MNRAPLLDDYRWLVSGEGTRWLERVAEDRRNLVALAERLRKDLSAQRVHLLLEQIELRRRARRKFLDAQRMFFTPRGLEQATDQFVAAYKAGRFPDFGPLADLCCGIGGDLAALARRAPTLGVDRDPVTALLAEANAAVLGLAAADPSYSDRKSPHRAGAEIRVDDVDRFALESLAAWHLDPDRRVEGRRTTRPETYHPGPATVRWLLGQWPHAAIKLAPAARLSENWAAGAELEWISRAGECRQLVAWTGDLAGVPGQRRATLVGSGADQSATQGCVRTLTGPGGGRLAKAPRIGRYLFEPDAAVLAAALVSILAEQHDLAALDPEIPYLTGDDLLSDPALASFEVTDVLSLDLKRLRRLLAARGVGRLEIKKRGVSLDPVQLRRRLQLRGDRSAVLLIAPIDGRVTAILARRGH